MLVWCFLIVAVKVHVYPKQIIFIRHAEKVKSDPVHLSERGRKRAEQLPTYINHMMSEGLILDLPNYLVAMRQNGQGHSNRPFETLEPLSDILEIPIRNDYTQKQVEEVAASINIPENKDKTVIVCWEHRLLTEIAQQFKLPVKGWNPEGRNYDSEDDFRTVWMVTNKKYEQFVNFQSFKMFDLDSRDNPVYNRYIYLPILDERLPKDTRISEKYDKSFQLLTSVAKSKSTIKKKIRNSCVSWLSWCY